MPLMNENLFKTHLVNKYRANDEKYFCTVGGVFMANIASITRDFAYV